MAGAASSTALGNAAAAGKASALAGGATGAVVATDVDMAWATGFATWAPPRRSLSDMLSPLRRASTVNMPCFPER
jgi:hypothetical protein